MCPCQLKEDTKDHITAGDHTLYSESSDKKTDCTKRTNDYQIGQELYGGLKLRIKNLILAGHSAGGGLMQDVTKTMDASFMKGLNAMRNCTAPATKGRGKK